MTQYIDKSALVAEIERRRDESWLGHYTKEKGIVFDITDDILSWIDTLEVKEVDLEKAIDDYIYTHDGRKRLALELDWKYCNLTLKGGDGIIKFAKHFFELGLRLQTETEYTRDAFIEKAVKWLEDNAINYWGTDAVDNGKMMLDFKIAMRL